MHRYEPYDSELGRKKPHLIMGRKDDFKFWICFDKIEWKIGCSTCPKRAYEIYRENRTR